MFNGSCGLWALVVPLSLMDSWVPGYIKLCQCMAPKNWVYHAISSISWRCLSQPKHLPINILVEIPVLLVSWLISFMKSPVGWLNYRKNHLVFFMAWGVTQAPIPISTRSRSAQRQPCWYFGLPLGCFCHRTGSSPRQITGESQPPMLPSLSWVTTPKYTQKHVCMYVCMYIYIYTHICQRKHIWNV